MVMNTYTTISIVQLLRVPGQGGHGQPQGALWRATPRECLWEYANTYTLDNILLFGFMCVCKYIHIDIHINIHIDIHIYIYVYIYICICVIMCVSLV